MDIQVVQFDKARESIFSSIRRHMLIPIIGSGFTLGCRSRNGDVPSGKQYSEYMLKCIRKHVPDKDYEEISGETFSGISTVYHEVVPEDQQHEYLRDHFTSVLLEDEKKDFLAQDWQYIYTLNIDDGIENNSLFREVIYANRPVREDVYDSSKCVIKLHGDVHEILTYKDTVSEVFDQKQYARSINQNASLLGKLTHDLRYQNAIFIGCSLDDEVDLMSLTDAEKSETDTIRYFCSVKEPSYINKIKLKKNYGITHCVLFETYESIYTELSKVMQEAMKISEHDLDMYRSYQFARLDSTYEKNKPYLFFGKSIVNRKERMFLLPSFFISRDETKAIIDGANSKTIQFIWGSGYSGKTYTAIDIAMQIRARDVYVFESKDRISKKAMELMITRGNCLIVADSGALTIEQIEGLIDDYARLEHAKVNFVIFANKNDRDLVGVLQLKELKGNNISGIDSQITIRNAFTLDETNTINQYLVQTNLGVFREKLSIIDNILEASTARGERSRFDQLFPEVKTERQIAAMIVLLIEKKVYQTRVIDYDLEEEMFELIKKSTTTC